MVAAPVIPTLCFCALFSPRGCKEKTQLSETTLHTLLIFPGSAKRTDKEEPRIFWKEERNPSNAPSFSRPNGPSTAFSICHGQGRLLHGGERGESGSRKRREQEEGNSLGWRPEEPHRTVEERCRIRRERTPRQSSKDKDAGHSPPSLPLCPHSNRAGKYQSQIYGYQLKPYK